MPDFEIITSDHARLENEGFENQIKKMEGAARAERSLLLSIKRAEDIVDKLVQPILADANLLKMASHLFTSLKFNDKTAIFIAIENLYTTIAAFHEVNKIEPDPDEINFFITILFYQYNNLSAEKIKDYILAPIKNGHNAEGNQLQENEELKNYASSAKENILSLSNAATAFTLSISNKLFISPQSTDLNSFMVRILQAVSGRLYSQKETEDEVDENQQKQWTNYLTAAFEAIQYKIADEDTDYRTLRNYASCAKKTLWVLMSYLIKFPEKTLKHDKQEEIESLLESIWGIHNKDWDNLIQESGELDKTKLLSNIHQKVDAMVAALKNFSETAGKKTRFALINYAIGGLEQWQRPVGQIQYEAVLTAKEKPGISHDNSVKKPIITCEDLRKITSNFVVQHDIDSLIKADDLHYSIWSVPVLALKQARKQMNVPMILGESLSKFFRFIRSFFINKSKVIREYIGKCDLSTLPTEFAEVRLDKIISTVKSSLLEKENPKQTETVTTTAANSRYSIFKPASVSASACLSLAGPLFPLTRFSLCA